MSGGDDTPTIPGVDGLELIGRGGFAVVYRGHQAAFRRDVAVKVLLRSGLGSDDRRRFDRECQAMGTLSEHPGIVTLYDAGFTGDGRPYLIMAYVRNGTLADALAADGPLGWEEATRLGVRLAGALETAHLAGVLHRDIKPANVLRATYGAQLSDFGIARIAGAHETRSGVITASVAHAAPEILDGQPPTFQADVYGLASTLYEALSGRPAFFQDTDEGLLPLIRRVVTDDPPDLRERGVPDQVAAVIERAMAKRPEDRHATARDFGLALRGAQAVLGIAVTDLVVTATTAPVAGAAPPAATTDVTSAPTEPPPAATTDVTSAPTEPPPAATTDVTSAPTEPPPADETVVAGTDPTPADVTTEQPPITAGEAHAADPDRGAPSTAKKAVLIAAVLLAVVALIGGLAVLDRGGDEPATEPTAVATAAPATSAGVEPTDPAVTEGTATVDGSAPATIAPVTSPETPPGSRVGLVAPTVEPTHPIHDGVRRAAEDLGLAVAVADPQAAPDAAIFEQITNGQDTIVVLAAEPFRQATVDAVRASADAHPDVDFVVLDAEVDAPNVASFTFPDHEGSFLVGVAAALASASGRVGFLGGTDSEAVRRYEAGFVAGVRHVAPTTQIDVRYLPGGGEHFFDAELASVVAAEIFEEGADIAFHAGTSGDGLFGAAASAGARAIGVDVDQAQGVPPEWRDSVLGSMVKAYDDVTYDAVVAATEGTLPYGVNELGVDRISAVTSTDEFESVPPQLVDLREEILAGQLAVPRTVERRALAPLGPDCPADGCEIRIIGVEPSGSELLLTLEANWNLDVAGKHAHYFFSPRYSPEQVGADSPARFGVAPGDWDLDDRYPQYVTEGAVSLSTQGDDAEMICVTAANAGHNVLDPSRFDCAVVPAG